MGSSYSILNHTGRMLRFVIDESFPLIPDHKQDFQFVGKCPKTKKAKGLIVNEKSESITLPYLNKKYVGIEGLNEFREKFKIHEHGPVKDLNNISEIEAKRLNTRLRKISLKAIDDGLALLKSNRRIVKRFTDCDLELNIAFYLCKNHRLYHPNSDNMLCGYSSTLSSKIEIDPADFNDTDRFTSFAHCYVFHDLIDHKGVALKDLVQVDFICIEYELLFQKNVRGFMK